VSKAQQDIRRKRQVLEYAQQIGNVRKACRYFGIGRAGFYLGSTSTTISSLRSPSTMAATRTCANGRHRPGT
jgi:hypothetical protein